MTDARAIERVYQSRPVTEGAGVQLHRAFGHKDAPMFDPFLLFDDFRGDEPGQFIAGFPWHPHRGIETITYMLEGTVEHGDSMGTSGVIHPGDVQWMTAGGGIVHQEMPKPNEKGRMGGFQLWTNLPAADKMMEPRYQEIKADEIPVLSTADGVEVRIVCGSLRGVDGPVRDIMVQPTYMDVSVPAGTVYEHPTEPGHKAVAYVFEGSAYFCPEKEPFSYEIVGENYFDFGGDPQVGNRGLVLFKPGERIVVTTEEQPVRFLLFTGAPIGEPVAWAGPIVMNTQAELAKAFEEYRNGTFLKHGNG